MTAARTRSPWVYVGIGCGALLLLFVVLAGTGVFVGIRAVRRAAAELEDPRARTETALRLLGAESLPPGYHAGPSFSLPFLFEMVLLVDRPPEPGGQIAPSTERVFVYVNVIRGGRWRDDAEGEADPTEMLSDAGLRIDRRELLARDEIVVADTKIPRESHRGRLRTGTGSSVDGITTILFFPCPEDSRLRLGIWVGPDPAPELPADELDLSGSTADPEAIRDLASRFDVCG